MYMAFLMFPRPFVSEHGSAASENVRNKLPTYARHVSNVVKRQRHAFPDGAHNEYFRNA